MIVDMDNRWVLITSSPLKIRYAAVKKKQFITTVYAYKIGEKVCYLMVEHYTALSLEISFIQNMFLFPYFSFVLSNKWFSGQKNIHQYSDCCWLDDGKKEDLNVPRNKHVMSNHAKMMKKRRKNTNENINWMHTRIFAQSYTGDCAQYWVQRSRYR